MRYTYVRQHDTTDCAAACLAMVCLHYKKEVTITRLRDMMGTDLKGTNLVGLQKAANELGFTTAAVRVDRENFLSDFSLPCIAQVITDQGLAHFVVVFKKTTIKDDGARRKHMLQDAESRKEEEEKGKKHKCKDYVIIGDPGTELKKISLDEFYKNFTGVLLLLNPTSEFKGGKIEKGGMMKRYINLLLPQKKLFFYAILSSIITTILGIASSMFNKILMDEVLPYGLNSLLVTLILVFSVVSITSTLIGFVRQWVLIHLSIKIDIPLMLGYFGHIFNLPMKFFATRKTGDITTRYSDANTIKSIFTSIALSLVMDISMAVITGIILFRMNAMLFSISLFMALVSILLVLVYKQPYKKINEESMAQSAALNSQMIESLRGIETVKCNANEQTELDNLEREYMKSLKISLRSSRISTTQGLISSFISTGFSMLTTYVGITQVLNGEMTLGGFMAFSTLSGYFTSPLSNLIGLQMQIQEASISMKRLTEIMDYPSEYETAEGVEQSELDKVEGDIEFKDVTFRYGNRAPALDHISFTIPAGKKVALVGGSGSGKSAYAEKYICHASNEKRYKEKYYIATMQVFDDEGQRKIDRHRRLRAGKGFITIEQPRDIQNAVSKLQSESSLKTGRSALLECMSNLVANEMFPPVDASGMQAAEAEKEALDATEKMKDYETAQISHVSKKVLKEVSILSKNVAELVIVTNNVFEDGVCYDESTMNYIKAMGVVNRGLAAMAERVVEVVAGIPVAVK